MTFRYLPSPHANARPPHTPVELLVIHAISLPPGQFGGPYVDDLFLGRLNPAADPYFPAIATLRVSAHFFIDRQGELTQYVPVLQRAWHAGVSSWQGREGCNDFSVGIELEGDEHTPFATPQYHTLATLIRTLGQRLPTLLRENAITGHQHIAPGRKWDPGPGFDWPHLFDLLVQAESNPDWPLVWQ